MKCPQCRRRVRNKPEISIEDGIIFKRWDCEYCKVKFLSGSATPEYWYKQKKQCNHKFIDSKHCLKCGWEP